MNAWFRPTAVGRRAAPSPAYGWVIVAIGFFSMALVVGSRFSLGLFLPYMPDSLDASVADVSAAFAISMLGSAALQPISGMMIDRLGGRTVLVVGLLFGGAALCGTAFATAVWQVAVLMGLVSSVAYAAVSPASITSIVSSWFERRRGVALGVATTGTKVAMIVLPPVLTALIVFHGWRAGMLALGLTIWLLIPPVLIFVRPAPGSAEAQRAAARAATGDASAVAVAPAVAPSSDVSLRRAVTTPAFWMITIGLFANGFMMNLVLIHLPNFVLNQGYAAAVAATGLVVVGGVGIPGTVLTGWLSDRLGRRTVLMLMFGARGVAMLGVVLMPGPVAFLAFIVVFGLLGYGLIGVVGALATEAFGRRSMGAILGTAYLFNQIGAACGTFAGGASVDWTGSFDTALWMAIATTAIAFVSAAVIGRR